MRWYKVTFEPLTSSGDITTLPRTENHTWHVAACGDTMYEAIVQAESTMDAWDKGLEDIEDFIKLRETCRINYEAHKNISGWREVVIYKKKSPRRNSSSNIDEKGSKMPFVWAV